MDFESNDTDNDENILFESDTSTEDDVNKKNSKKLLIEHEKSSSNTRKNLCKSLKIIFIFLINFPSLYSESNSSYKYVQIMFKISKNLIYFDLASLTI